MIFSFMSNLQNHNWKVLEKAQAGSNSDDVKTALSSPLLQVLEKSFAILMSFFHIE